MDRGLSRSREIELDRTGPLLRWGVPGLVAVFHLATSSGYGIFRDELYYLACGEHPAWGYVDHPPLAPLLAAAVRATLGTSTLALRLLPALAAALFVALAGSLAVGLGGRRPARLLAQLGAATAPVFLSLFGIFSMNAFDLLFWASALRLLVELLDDGPPELWLAFGLVAGVGLQNKVSMLFLGFGTVVGLLLGGRRDLLATRWPWLGGGIAALVFLPHLLWQRAHGWPTLEFMENARRLKNVALDPLTFLAEQFRMMGPATAVLWVSGLVYLLSGLQMRRFRPLGWGYLAVLGVMLVTAAKPYYLAAAYAPLIAAGAVGVEHLSLYFGRRILRFAVALVVVGANLALAPFAKAILPVESFVRYSTALGVQPGTDERHEIGRLPQFFADQVGWRELAETVAAVHRALPAEEREHACVFAQNYGQAGAIDLYGPSLGLPKAISAHNSYWLWGPRACSGEVVIVIGDRRQRLEELFADVQLGATYRCSDCMPYEAEKPIWIARHGKVPIADLWPRIRSFI